MSDARTVKLSEVVAILDDAGRAALEAVWSRLPRAAETCVCGAPLLFSARQRGNGRCGPCTRGAEFRTIAIADQVNHDPGDEDRRAT